MTFKKSGAGNPASAGFTLIEIIIVLFIIGIASGLVGVWISRGSGSLETKKFTKEISAVLRYARTRAVAEKKIYCFSIDKEKQALILFTEEVDYKNVAILMDKPIPEEVQMTLLDRDEESSHVAFFPRGNSTGGAISILNENGKGYWITINKITGKVDVVKTE